jgi:arginine deiminase
MRLVDETSSLPRGDVRSEVGTLRQVLVHRPGAELDALTPGNAATLLFDRVPAAERARAEHDALTATLRGEGVEVVRLRDVLAAGLGTSPERAERLIAGDGDDGLPPLPNAMFVRDSSAWLGTELVVGAVGNPVRRREGELLARSYAGDGHRVALPGVEGGDLFCLDERTVLVGVGRRSSVVAVEALAEALFAAGFERVLAIEIPDERASIHLDCLMTLVDVDLLLIDRRLRGSGVVEMLPRGAPVESRIHLSVETALADALGLDAMRVVEVADEHEQWTLAANTLAVAPGRVVAFAHNRRTNEALAVAGVEVLAVPGEQLARGHGGPRCLTCPLARDAVPGRDSDGHPGVTTHTRKAQTNREDDDVPTHQTARLQSPRGQTEPGLREDAPAGDRRGRG